jgi:ribosomal protein RSM22 (predicted rRNA methylase)
MRATVPLSKISPSIHSVHLPTVSLPFKLQQALDVILSNYPRKTLISDGQAITKYVMNRQPPSDYNTRRRRMTNDGRDVLQTPLRYNRRECLAYAASRTQSVYGATYRVFNEISKIDTSFHPEAMLDFGSGLGTAVWAGHRVWGDSLYEYQMIDSSPLMGELSKALLNGGSDWSTELWSASSTCDAKAAINNVYFKQFLPVSSKVSYDLVVSAYSLSELPTMSLWKQVLLSLWRKTKQYLVLIEVGTPNGFGLISHARDFILKANDWDKDIIPNDEVMRGHIFAPVG